MVFGSLGSSANQVLIKIKGDDKDFQGAINRSDKSMDGFAAKAKAAGPMIGAAFAAAAVGFVAMSVKMAAAEEAVTRQTEALLKSQGIMWGSVKSEVTDYINELEALTAYNDTDLQVAFNSMIAAGMSYTEAMDSMNTVTAMSFSLNRDLASMALLVGKAYNGQTGELSRYGIVLDETLDKSEKFIGLQKYVADNFANAEERTDSLEGSMGRLKNSTDDVMEALGARLIPEITSFTDHVFAASGGAEEFGDVLGRLAAMPLTLPRMLGEHTANMITINKLRREGIDTEGELVNLLQLSGDELVNMNDEEFKYKTKLLEISGYHEKIAKLETARSYGQSQKLRALNDETKLEQALLDIKQQQTEEGEKQLSTMRERAAAAQREIEARNAINSISGTDMSGLSSTAGKYTARESYTRQSGGATIFFSGNNSGV